MGGIIVIDFVDMLIPANRDEVLKRFKRELARDKTKSRVMEISRLGLVQMTRKNVSQGSPSRSPASATAATDEGPRSWNPCWADAADADRPARAGVLACPRSATGVGSW